jgi:hypothetical protein
LQEENTTLWHKNLVVDFVSYYIVNRKEKKTMATTTLLTDATTDGVLANGSMSMTFFPSFEGLSLCDMDERDTTSHRSKLSASQSPSSDENDSCASSNSLKRRDFQHEVGQLSSICLISEKPGLSNGDVAPETTGDHNEIEFEDDIHRRSPDNSLLDSVHDEENDEGGPTAEPPSPPQQSKLVIRRWVPPTKLSTPVPSRRTNHVLLHIYDLIASDTLMQLPWGCVCEIGKCFNEVNSALHELGTGAYHVGVECNGIEYAYGACNQPNKTGVFSCIPKLSPGYQYRSSIDFGFMPLIRSSWVIVPTSPTSTADNINCSSPRSICTGSSFRYAEDFVDGRLVIKEMAAEYMGIDYDILKRNCCSFAADACVRLGVPEDQVPTWFRNLAETGAYSHTNFVEPIQHVLSSVGNQNSKYLDGNSSYSKNVNGASSSQQYNQQHQFCCSTDDQEPGFEVIAKRNASNTRDVLVVIHAEPSFIARPFRPYRKSAAAAH